MVRGICHALMKVTDLLFKWCEIDPCFFGDEQSARIVPGFTWTHTILLQKMLGRSSHGAEKTYISDVY